MRHCVWELLFVQSLGNWEEKSREEQSQETCLYVESQICGPRILFSQMTSKIREYCSFIGGETVAETRPFCNVLYQKQAIERGMK